MIVIITGASHTGKTALAQRLLEKYNYPYLSIDHLKMGLIRSGQTKLTPESDDGSLTSYLWPIVCEMIKTAIENGQNMIVEGCYIPQDFDKWFEDFYLDLIRAYCLVFSKEYIEKYFDSITKYENVIENRLYSDYTKECALEDNEYYMTFAQNKRINTLIIDGEYNVDVTL